ncbi:tyrosyl-DNA phosphodiesterase 1-like protein [Corchorus olitorius]|uniref:Tyrosyl-DNA phosphodiesterase 1-like protein n=1 Tax=Corchorus olitorius TaxID=93759 RepID=A0A1R3HY31_9ROSI|nr:tyrosyl-DNA phosphodiesterase 1-like protein [Corchorus olitorius]
MVNYKRKEKCGVNAIAYGNTAPPPQKSVSKTFLYDNDRYCSYKHDDSKGGGGHMGS